MSAPDPNTFPPNAWLSIAVAARRWGKQMSKRDVEYVRADLAAAPQWRSDMENAPRDGTIILAWCKNDCSGPCAWAEGEQELSRNLCLYHAHAEGLSGSDDGFQLIKWGGGWSDSYEDGGGELPDFWFTHDSEFERVANPIQWMPLPTPPETET